MSTSRIGLHVRITPVLRDRIELGRLAGFHDRPLDAPTTQAFIETLLETGLVVHAGGTVFAASSASWGMTAPAGAARSMIASSPISISTMMSGTG